MRTYGRIETAIWQNARVRALSERAQRLLIYLFACPHGSVVGTFVLPTGYIVADLAWDEATAAKQLAELTDAEFIERDQASGLTRLTGWWGHNGIENPNVARAAVKYALALPDGPIKTATIRDMLAVESKNLTPLKNELSAAINHVSKQSAPSSETVSKAFRTMEPEPEPEPNLTGTGAGSLETETPPAPMASPEGDKTTNEALAVIALFDAEIGRLWGNARPWPAADDLTMARRWIAAGLDLPFIEGVMRSVLSRKHRGGTKAPTSLSYIAEAVEEAHTKRGRGVASPGRDGSGRYKRQSTDTEVAEAVAEKVEHERRLAANAKAGAV